MSRIVMLTPWERLWAMGSGGTPSEAYLLEALLARGHRIDLVAPPADVDDFPPHAGLRVIRTPAAASRPGPLLARQRGWIDLSARLVRTARATARPDLVYGLSALATPAAAACGRRWGAPSIGKLYGTFLLPTVGHPLAMAGQFEEVLAFRSPVTGLVVHDDGTGGDLVARHLRVPADRLHFWRNGVDRAACERAVAEADADAMRGELGLAAGTPLVYTASRLAGWKRVDRILRALALVVEQVPQARLAIAGDGAERGSLERLAEELGVAGATRFLGPVQRDRNLRFMAASDVFCATYDYSCVGNALQEAMSCGAAVVTVDSGRTMDLVRDGRNGRMVARDDIPALAEAITGLLLDPPLARRLGEGALRDARAELPTKEDRAAREVALAEELIGRSGAARRRRPRGGATRP